MEEKGQKFHNKREKNKYLEFPQNLGLGLGGRRQWKVLISAAQFFWLQFLTKYHFDNLPFLNLVSHRYKF